MRLKWQEKKNPKLTKEEEELARKTKQLARKAEEVAKSSTVFGTFYLCILEWEWRFGSLKDVTPQKKKGNSFRNFTSCNVKLIFFLMMMIFCILFCEKCGYT
ncbi:hypothetical protein Ddye_020480 [Dipteronia dyeriana]|uniref:Uncharacterized protein n=1 Tax=Dipteronia dyeriana TaxID=168575 RepID=A0AAD9WX33_9ROSI|nr:hypothetical protein Ddye_020480 [Dipteronia dyeriana]